MSIFGTIMGIAFIFVALYLIVKWYSEMLADAKKSEREEKLERENAHLKRTLRDERAINKRLQYERTHTTIEFKEM